VEERGFATDRERGIDLELDRRIDALDPAV
jgi:hypothetical protein